MHNTWLCDHHTCTHVYSHTYMECFISCGNYGRGWFPKPLWSEKFLSTFVLFSWIVFWGCPSICIHALQWNAHTTHILVLYTTRPQTVGQWHKFQAYVCTSTHSIHDRTPRHAAARKCHFQNPALSKSYCKLYEFPFIKLNSDVTFSV
jgi:hypothetical protein